MKKSLKIIKKIFLATSISVVLSLAFPVNVIAFESLDIGTASSFIGSDRAGETVISIYKDHAEDSARFEVPNMFPGDREMRSYLVRVAYRGRITVRFRADIKQGYEKLAEVLKCKIILRGENKTLYDDLMRDMPGSVDHRIYSYSDTLTELAYDITVYLDTSVGNEYMNKELVADFCWWVVEHGGSTPSVPDETTSSEDTVSPDETTYPNVTIHPDDTADPNETTAPRETSDPEYTTYPDDTSDPETTAPNHGTDSDNTTAPGPDDGELIYPPQTGDDFHLCIWFWIAVISLLFNIILLLSKRNRDNGERRTANG
ncbi:MAG: hypothetical protein IKT56_00710 [Clostridia bacterium]|nr:hypothetical protein [Clostridia bacterium]